MWCKAAVRILLLLMMKLMCGGVTPCTQMLKNLLFKGHFKGNSSNDPTKHVDVFSEEKRTF